MCTRIIYNPKKGDNYVGRNMDWSVMPSPTLWVLPKNTKRNSCVITEDKESFTWVSKHSSVIVSNFDADPKSDFGATSDGLNSSGLTANILWLAKSDFPTYKSKIKKDSHYMSISIWAQYILDMCESVEDAILAMNTISVLTTTVPGDETKTATCHLSVGDNQGNSAIFEYIDKNLVIYTNVDVKNSLHTIMLYSKNKMKVMTNDPEFNKQVESLVYWDELNKKYENEEVPALLPGSNLPLDRFIRAYYFANQLSDNLDSLTALAQLSAIMNNVAQPTKSYSLSKTQYTSFAYSCYIDKNKYKLQYFYRSGNSPFIIWINLNDICFEDLKGDEVYKLPLNEEGAFVSHLDVTNNYGSGNVNTYLEKSKMFTFITVKK